MTILTMSKITNEFKTKLYNYFIKGKEADRAMTGAPS